MVKLPGWLMLVCAALVPACTTIAAASVSPEWLKLTAGALGGSAVSLLALTPGWRKPLATYLFLLAAALVLAPRVAHAQALTVGPSLPAFAITPGAGHPVTLAAGAGFTVGADFFPTTLLDQKVHWLTVGLDAFGSLVPVGSAVGGNGVDGPARLRAGAVLRRRRREAARLSGGAGALDGKLDHRSFFILFEPDCRVMKLLWPAITARRPPERSQADKPDRRRPPERRGTVEAAAGLRRRGSNNQWSKYTPERRD
jgi:hypothetical protein